MADKKQKSQSTEKKALELAEKTDVSPKQARDLMEKHGKNSKTVHKKAKNFKAES